MKTIQIGNDSGENPIAEQHTKELLFRLKIIRLALKTLRTDPEIKDDPRQPKAIKEYTAQLMQVRAELKRRNALPRTQIELKTAVVHPKGERP